MARKNKGAINKQLWDRANSTHRRKWQFTSQKGFDFYLDEQLTKDESDSLKESGMPSFTINRVLPIVEIMKYFVTAQNPRWKAVGVTGDDADIAQVHSEISEYCWYLSNGKSLYSQVILDSLTKGVGYFLVDVDQDMDIGKGEVIFKRIEPYDVFVDPMSRDFLFRDAGFITVRKNVTRTQLKNLFPEFSRKIQRASPGSGSGVTETLSLRDRDESKIIQQEDVSLGIGRDGDDDDIIAYYETYQKVKKPFINAYIKSPPDEVEMREIQKAIDVEIKEFAAEMTVQLEEKKLQIQQALQSGEIIPDRAQLELEKAEKDTAEAIERQKQVLMSQAQEIRSKIEQTIIPEADFKELMKEPEFASKVVDSVKFYEARVDLVCSVGDDTFLYEYELPINEYPIIPIPYIYTGTPYPMSAVMPLIGKQQEINKAHQIMIHNANLASNLRWLYEEGSVDEEEWERYSSSPGALLKYRQGLIHQHLYYQLQLTMLFIQ